ncbi:MAG: hypothetical protein RJQ04_21950 [Longimicrobiales bacterium]
MTRRRRILGLACLAALALHGAVVAQWMAPSNRAARALEAGDGPAAIRILRAVDAAERSPLDRYHLGTALLSVDDPSAAADQLEAALAAAVGPGLRHRVAHNLALAHLLLASQAGPGEAAVQALASVAAGRTALRLDPADEGARWNLALATRRLGVSAPDRPDDADEAAARPESPGAAGRPQGASSGAMTEDEARRLLDALGSAEGVRIRLPLTGQGRGR